MINFSRQQHIFGQFIIVAVILANFYWLKSDALGLIFAIIYLWLNSKKISDMFATGIHQGLRNVIGLVSILSYISLIYTIAYHIYAINDWVFLFTFISLPIILEVLSYYYQTTHYFLNNFKFGLLRLSTIRKSLLPLAVLILDIVIFVALWKKASLGVLRSPWELTGYKFWSVFIVSNICLVLSILDKKSTKNILLLSLHFLLLSSIVIILYPLGFGYDSFIHQAVIRNIAETGTIQPRLWLYTGQYALTFFFHSISQIPLVTINKLLLPILFSLLWPTSLFYGLRYGLNWSFKISYLATLWSLFIGFNFVIMTTPQSLAYLLVALFVFILPEINKKNISLYFAWIISIMALTIHPLGGLPLISFTALLGAWRLKKYRVIKKILVYLIMTGSYVALPLFFALYQKLNGFAWSEIFTINLDPLLRLPTLHWYQTYSFPVDWLHNIGDNQLWLYTLLTLVGLYLIFRENKYIFFKKLLIFISILIINYLLSGLLLSFNLQINYQKNDYIDRIGYLIAILVLPILLTTVYFWFKDIVKNGGHWQQKIFITALTVLVISTSTYFSYPIYDKHGNSKSFNVTATDLKTVELINQDAKQEPYIVLANQMVGAAAISQYGFANYYNDNFYYSMPLGNNNIYQNYLNMIEISATRDEALLAMEKAGVNKLYFVINNYWHSAKQAINQAEQSADAKIIVDDGVNIVFIYNK